MFAGVISAIYGPEHRGRPRRPRSSGSRSAIRGGDLHVDWHRFGGHGTGAARGWGPRRRPVRPGGGPADQPAERGQPSLGGRLLAWRAWPATGATGTGQLSSTALRKPFATAPELRGRTSTRAMSGTASTKRAPALATSRWIGLIPEGWGSASTRPATWPWDIRVRPDAWPLAADAVRTSKSHRNRTPFRIERAPGSHPALTRPDRRLGLGLARSVTFPVPCRLATLRL